MPNFLSFYFYNKTSAIVRMDVVKEIRIIIVNKLVPGWNRVIREIRWPLALGLEYRLPDLIFLIIIVI